MLALGTPPSISIITQLAEGDRILDKPLSQLATASPGIFTKELEVWLQSGAASVAVHSLKDVPTHLPDGLTLTAISERAAPEDAAVLSKASLAAGYRSLADLPEGSLVGTSSLRREALLKRKYPGLRVAPVRGNLNTRIRKLDGTHEGAAADAPVYAALVLAKAGLERLGWGERVTEVLDPSDFPYGVSQGALGIEVRGDDGEAAAVALAACEHPPSAARCQAERAFLRGLQGGCQVPIGVASELVEPPEEEAGAGESVAGEGGVLQLLRLRGLVLSRDGQKTVEGSVEGLVRLPAAGEAPRRGNAPRALEAPAALGVADTPASGGGSGGEVSAALPPSGATHELHFGAAPSYWHEAAAVGEALARELLGKGAGALLLHGEAGAGAMAEGGEVPAGLGRAITYGSAEGEAEAGAGGAKGATADSTS